MADYCTTSDVSERLGRDLTVTELNQFPALLQDATVLQIDPVLGKSFADASPIPPVVVSVAANILKRTFQANSANPLGVDVTVGPVRMGAVVKMLPSEEKALQDFAAKNGGKSGVSSVELVSSQGVRNRESWWV